MSEEKPTKRSSKPSNRKANHSKVTEQVQSSKSIDQMIKAWTKDVENLSYEESLQALDLLLAQLQSDSVPVADLQKHYIHGQVYLKHCESLLNTLETNIIELDPDTMLPQENHV